MGTSYISSCYIDIIILRCKDIISENFKEAIKNNPTIDYLVVKKNNTKIIIILTPVIRRYLLDNWNDFTARYQLCELFIDAETINTISSNYVGDMLVVVRCNGTIKEIEDIED